LLTEKEPVPNKSSKLPKT